MFRWSIRFITIAILAGVLGFGGILGKAATWAKTLSIIFTVLFILTLIKNSFKGIEK